MEQESPRMETQHPTFGFAEQISGNIGPQTLTTAQDGQSSASEESEKEEKAGTKFSEVEKIKVDLDFYVKDKKRATLENAISDNIVEYLFIDKKNQ